MQTLLKRTIQKNCFREPFGPEPASFLLEGLIKALQTSCSSLEEPCGSKRKFSRIGVHSSGINAGLSQIQLSGRSYRSDVHSVNRVSGSIFPLLEVKFISMTVAPFHICSRIAYLQSRKLDFPSLLGRYLATEASERGSELDAEEADADASSLLAQDSPQEVSVFRERVRDVQRFSDSDDEGLRIVELPLLHPKASVTSEHHPCGAELLEFPFSAKAFYIGKDRKDQLRKLKKHATAKGWQREQYGSGLNATTLYCLRKSDMPFNEREDFTGLPCESYIMTLNRLDSVVFFNGGGEERGMWKQYTGGFLTEQYIEEARVSVIPSLDSHSKLFSDRIVLQQAELNYLRTIAYVMGQTVSLHYYEMSVDHILRRFKEMNQTMHQTGSWKEVAKKKDLLQMVAKNNLLFTDIISRLGIMERFDLAWKNTDCSDIYEHLRSDMEITNRNSNLQVKLQLVSENVKYLLELMQNEKSDFLEWIIIVLIGAEILISLSEMAHKLA